MKLDIKTPISSVDLIAHFGVQATYKNAARAAQRLVKNYNLPLRQRGNGQWVSTIERKEVPRTQSEHAHV